jgi:hypothetical protein
MSKAAFYVFRAAPDRGQSIALLNCMVSQAFKSPSVRELICGRVPLALPLLCGLILYTTCAFTAKAKVQVWVTRCRDDFIDLMARRTSVGGHLRKATVTINSGNADEFQPIQP